MSNPLTPTGGGTVPSKATTTKPLTTKATTNTVPDTTTVHGEVHQETVLQPSPAGPSRETVVERQEERFGGVKFGSAFFGWLTATGMAVLLISLLAAAGVGFGLANTNVDQAMQETQNATDTAKTVGLIGGIALLVILFVAYYCGGYVAGRMARFNGVRQGLAVWIWGIVIVVIIAIIAAVAGSQYDIFAQLNLPRIPVNEGQLTTTAIIAVVAAILAALAGALLGGKAGMHFHRKVDDAGFRRQDDHDAMNRARSALS